MFPSLLASTQARTRTGTRTRTHIKQQQYSSSAPAIDIYERRPSKTDLQRANMASCSRDGSIISPAVESPDMCGLLLQPGPRCWKGHRSSYTRAQAPSRRQPLETRETRVRERERLKPARPCLKWTTYVSSYLAGRATHIGGEVSGVTRRHFRPDNLRPEGK